MDDTELDNENWLSDEDAAILDELRQLEIRSDEALDRHVRAVENTLGVPIGYTLFELDTTVPIPRFISGADGVFIYAGTYATKLLTPDVLAEYKAGDTIQPVYDVIQSFDIPEDERPIVRLMLKTEEGAEQAEQALLFSISVRLVPILETPAGHFGISDLATSLMIMEADDPEAMAARYNELCAAAWSRVPAPRPIRDRAHEIIERPKQDTARPHKHVQTLSKISNNLTDPDVFEDGGVWYDVGRQPKKIQTQLVLSYEGVELSRPLDEYDMLVLDGLATLWEAGTKNFSLDQLYYGMTFSDKRPSKGTKDDLAKRLDYVSSTRASIDCTDAWEEWKKHGRLTDDVDGIDHWKVKGDLADIVEHELTGANGRILKRGYTMTRPPLVYSHDLRFGQVTRHTKRELQAGGGNDTKQRIIIKRAILRRVEILRRAAEKRRGPGISNRLKYETLCEKAGIDPNNRTLRSRTSKYVKAVLDDLVALGKIKGYTEVRESGKNVGVDLKV